MTLGRIAFCFLLSWGFAQAQSGDTLEIRGVITEPGPGVELGVAGAQVTLYEFEADPAHASERKAVTTNFTDASGAFQFHPAHFGRFYVEIKKDGYLAKSFSGPTVAPADTTGEIVILDGNHRSQEFHFSLMRLGELRGRVVDEQGKPLAGVRLQVHAVSSDWPSFAGAVTDKDGNFAAEKLTPGDYLVRIVPQHAGTIGIIREFSGDDPNVVDQDLEASEWPGGFDERSAWPVTVSSGSAMSAGLITAHTVPYYRARVSVRSGDCAPGEQWEFFEVPKGSASGFAVPMKVPCGKDFLVRNLKPGSYWFSLSNGQKAEKYQWARTSVEVTRKNLEVALTMSPGMELRGQVVAAEGVELPGSRPTIRLAPLIGTNFGIAAALDPASKFLVKNLEGVPLRVSAAGLSGKYYVAEVRQDGHAVGDGVITPASGSLLEIVIDDKAATLTGSVANAEQPRRRATVIAAKWPPAPQPDGTFSMMTTESAGDPQGRFRIGGLAPGEYRVVAVPPGGARPGTDVLMGLLSAGQTVTLDRGGVQDVSLTLTKP
jgi:hypothetical protein